MVKGKKSRLMKRKKTSRVSIRTMVVAGISVVAAGSIAYLVFFTSIFEIREIRLHGGRYLPIDSLRIAADGYLGKNIFTFGGDEFKKSMTSFQEISTVSFRRRLFHTVDCYLHERTPVALIAIDEMAGVDAFGTVIPQRAGSVSWDVDLPVITGIEPGEIFEESGKIKIASALEILGLLKDFGFSPAEELSEIHLDSYDVVLVWMGGGTEIQIGKKRFHERIRNFRAVYDALGEAGTFPKSIDLRFERQVVIR
ncbi:MAG: cell division protein FtsQ/DivIB [Candidatus Krumholzibacteriota bacterium]|nr:cell division protein FtsQ/DivIB [Candidatus Krumholzibacteriota bacterium]